MSIGLGLLRLAPSDFWAMTPREFERAASTILAVRQPRLARSHLVALMTEFPDRKEPGKWRNSISR